MGLIIETRSCRWGEPSELEHTEIETIQNKTQKEKKKQKPQNISDLRNNIEQSNVCQI